MLLLLLLLQLVYNRFWGRQAGSQRDGKLLTDGRPVSLSVSLSVCLCVCAPVCVRVCVAQECAKESSNFIAFSWKRSCGEGEEKICKVPQRILLHFAVL